MKKLNLRLTRQACSLLILMAVSTFGVAQTPSPASKPPPATAPGADPAPPATPEQISYWIGENFGTKMHSTGIVNELSLEAITRGIKDGLQGKQTTPAEQQQIQAFVRSVSEAALARNQAAGKEYLARNGHAAGVVTTASGLQYKILAAGDKKAPAITPTDTATV